jgi:hypothetical protein
METRMSRALTSDDEEAPLLGERHPGGTSMGREPASLKDGSYAGFVYLTFLKTPARTSRSYERIKDSFFHVSILFSFERISQQVPPTPVVTVLMSH